MTEQIAFWILSAIAVLGALVAVRKRNLIHGVFALMIFFAALSGLFLLLLAEFIAAAQVLVYIGAVGILLLFAIMLVLVAIGVPLVYSIGGAAVVGAMSMNFTFLPSRMFTGVESFVLASIPFFYWRRRFSPAAA